MTKVNPKEHYRRINANIPTLGFRLDKDEMEKFGKMAKKLQTSRSTLGRSIVRSIVKGVAEKKLEISSNEEKDAIAIKFSEPMKIEVPKSKKKPKLTALKFAEEAYKYSRNE